MSYRHCKRCGPTALPAQHIASFPVTRFAENLSRRQRPADFAHAAKYDCETLIAGLSDPLLSAYHASFLSCSIIQSDECQPDKFVGHINLVLH